MPKQHPHAPHAPSTHPILAAGSSREEKLQTLQTAAAFDHTEHNDLRNVSLFTASRSWLFLLQICYLILS